MFGKIAKYFTRVELILFFVSYLLIIFSFILSPKDGFLSLLASLIGVPALILCAKGNPIGQGLIILFSTLYGIISYGVGYYGEMITYLGMSMPMAVLSLITWIRNPYGEGHSEVRVGKLRKGEVPFMILLTLAVTIIFYFILGALGTSNLWISTFSVTTSFGAVYLTFRRSPYYAVLYAANDLVLIIMWIIAAFTDISYLSVVVCFAVFMANDIYGFAAWRRREISQSCGNGGK